MGNRSQRRPDKGKWLTHRQRCKISDERPEPADREDSAFGDAIRKAIGSMDLGETMWLRALEDEWVDLVGEDVARHARPGRYTSGRLIVFVDSAVWMSELSRYRKDEMLQEMQQRFGRDKISSVSLHPDPEGQG